MYEDEAKDTDLISTVLMILAHQAIERQKLYFVMHITHVQTLILQELGLVRLSLCTTCD
jgi:hypothetical protein